METESKNTYLINKQLPFSTMLDSLKCSLQEKNNPDILVVDDVPDNIRFLSNFLTIQGYDVRKAIDGEMALRAVKALMPDLILLDVNMPNMSGYDVCIKLKKDPSTCSVPIIFLSAGNEVFDKVKAFQVGGADYITKPFQLEEVLVRIQTQLTIRELQQKQNIQNIELQQALNDLKQAQANLVQQEKMATLKKVVAGVAHEVNNPLSFILSNTEPAQQYIHDLLTLIELYQQCCQNPSPAVESCINEIDIKFVASDLKNLIHSMRKGADRIHSVMLALKNFTHLDEEGVKRINIHDAVETTLTILQHRLEPKTDGVSIQVYKEYGILPLITSYADQLNQVIFNLLINALDAVEAKINKHSYQFSNPQISISTQLTSDNTALIRIKDNGIGICEAHQARLFEPFFTTKPAGRGLGLGLVTSRRIIEEMHNGSLTYCSCLGEGAEFVIQIPI